VQRAEVSWAEWHPDEREIAARPAESVVPRVTYPHAMRTLLALTAVTLATLAAVSPASATVTNCGSGGTAYTGLAIVNVRAVGVSCPTAERVAQRWRGKDRYTAVVNGKRWQCRVTQHATGTDPGFIPRTQLRCARPTGSVVRFELAS
jgi:hypothetical protein